MDAGALPPDNDHFSSYDSEAIMKLAIPRSPPRDAEGPSPTIALDGSDEGVDTAALCDVALRTIALRTTRCGRSGAGFPSRLRPASLSMPSL